MSRDITHRSLHHDVRGAFSAVGMNLQTIEALAEVVELADRLRAESSARTPGAPPGTP